jgi:hypothetical protein
MQAAAAKQNTRNLNKMKIPMGHETVQVIKTDKQEEFHVCRQRYRR